MSINGQTNRSTARRSRRRRGTDPWVLEAMRNYVPNRNRIHLQPTIDGQWVVRREGATRATRIMASKDAAIGVAERLARDADDGQLIIHRPDCWVEERRPLGRAAQTSM